MLTEATPALQPARMQRQHSRCGLQTLHARPLDQPEQHLAGIDRIKQHTVLDVNVRNKLGQARMSLGEAAKVIIMANAPGLTRGCEGEMRFDARLKIVSAFQGREANTLDITHVGHRQSGERCARSDRTNQAAVLKQTRLIEPLQQFAHTPPPGPAAPPWLVAPPPPANSSMCAQPSPGGCTPPTISPPPRGSASPPPPS